ncbi:D-alanyl-D-alanine carboxypeptidase [Rhodobacterales bacterium HKCCE2091]|nr:D-alanyl-D-alanine carboxypeptidase [Rhodobacterales bacterium HKCCE2091]
MLLAMASQPLFAAPYAAMVMDARTGEVLHSRNADTRLHPASLTKMMTLYIAFEAVQRGEISMDTEVTISRQAAATAYALGFQAGSRVELRYLVRAAAVRSSNDAAAAIAEAISGSEAAFARRMNRTAQALGMTRTTFRNPHGLTHSEHLSTARDMTILGRHLFYDFPQYYNIFGRSSTYAGPVGTVPSTFRQVLANYRGADGIKTGFTNAAGFNIVSSAERDGVRIIATVFGGTSAASRNQRVMELLDMGFARAPANATVRPPAAPAYEGEDDELGGTQGRVIRMSGAVSRSPRPVARPGRDIPAELVAAIEDSVGAALAAAVDPEPSPAAEPETDLVAAAVADVPGAEDAPAALAEALPELAATAPPPRDSVLPDAAPEAEAPVTEVAEAAPDAVVEPDSLEGEETAVAEIAAVDAPVPAPEPAPRDTLLAAVEAAVADAVPQAAFAATPEQDGIVLLSGGSVSAARPRPRPIDVSDVVARAAPLEPEVVTRSSSNGSRLFGVSLGRYPTENDAERLLLTTALAELGTFDQALRHVANRGDGYEARFAGMTEDEAARACARLAARAMECVTFGPS